MNGHGLQDLVRIFERFRKDYGQHHDWNQKEHSAENLEGYVRSPARGLGVTEGDLT